MATEWEESDGENPRRWMLPGVPPGVAHDAELRALMERMDRSVPTEEEMARVEAYRRAHPAQLGKGTLRVGEEREVAIAPRLSESAKWLLDWTPVPGAREYYLAGTWFRLKHPELLPALADQERFWHNPATDAQDLLAHYRTPGPKETLGPLQLSTATIRNIEKQFLEGPYPEDLKQHLLPRVRDDRDAANRVLDPHWSRVYAAAWIHMYEHRKGSANPLGFMDWWNENPGAGNPLAFYARRHYREVWYRRGPALLASYRSLSEGLDR